MAQAPPGRACTEKRVGRSRQTPMRTVADLGIWHLPQVSLVHACVWAQIRLGREGPSHGLTRDPLQMNACMARRIHEFFFGELHGGGTTKGQDALSPKLPLD